MASSPVAMAGSSHRWRREAGGLLLVTLACLLFFWKPVTLRGVFFYYDHALQNYPFRLFFAQGLQDGRLPLWTPDLFCGFPLFAESQGNAAYPLFLVLFGLLPPWIAYNYYTVLHFLWAGVSAYTLARVLRISRTGAALAGICYMLSGPVLYHTHHTNIVVAASWLPMLLALIELAFLKRSWWPFLAFAAASACLALGGQPQYTLYCALVCGMYLLWRLRLVAVTSGAQGRAARLLAGFVLAGALSAMLACVQLLPLAELLGQTSRGSGAFTGPSITFASPGHLMTLLLPHYHGSPGLGSYWGHPGVGLYSEMTLFVGVASIFLALTGVLSDGRRSTVFFAGLGVFAFIFSLGFSGGLYSLFAWLPVLRSTRFASRFAFVTGLCVAVLAGRGFDLLTRRPARYSVRRAAVISAGAMLVVATLFLAIVAAFQGDLTGLTRAQLARAIPLPEFEFGVLWAHLTRTLPADVWRLVAVSAAATILLLLGARRVLPRPVTAALWIALIAGELTYVGREFTAVTDPALYLEPPPIVQRLRELPPGRVFHYQYGRLGERWPGAFPQTRGSALQPALYAHCLDRLPANANMIWGVPSVGGFSPLQTLALKTLLGQPGNSGTMIDFEPGRVLDLLGTRYLLSRRPDVPVDWPHLDEVSGVHIFENPHALPRAFVVGRASLATDDAAAVNTLTDSGLDYRQAVLVHDPRDLMPAGGEPDEPTGTAEVVDDTGDNVTVRATLERPGYLVLADQYYPGWRVEVDGRPERLLRVDYLLKGVHLEPGEHTVRFRFRPASFRVGLAVTLAGLVLLLAGVAYVVGVRARLAGPAEDPPLPDAPCSRRTMRMACLWGLIFLALGPALSSGLWQRARLYLTPRFYGAAAHWLEARNIAMDGDLAEAYSILRRAHGQYPDDPWLSNNLVYIGTRLVGRLVRQGQADEARAVAAELMAMEPAAVRAQQPIVARLARPEP